MAATVTNAWGKPGAWALDSEEHEEELIQQQKNESAATANNRSAAVPLSDFPSLSAVATTKTKKKKPQTVSLAEFTTYDPVKAREAKLTHEDMMNLPKGPRERSAEELERTKGFRSFGIGGGNSSESRWGSSNNTNSRGSDEPRRQGSFGRDSNKEFTPSRADEIDDWGAAKKTNPGGGFERRERGERGGFFENSQSKADESDNWVSNKSYVPSDGRRYERQRVGFESSGGADLDNWGKKKEDDGRKFGAFDSLRERRGVGFESGNGGGAGSDNWGKKREEVGNASVRPKLNLQPRKVPIGEEPQNGDASKPKGSNPFGDARPREEVLKEKGQDWKEVDEKLESLKLKEKEAGLADGTGFGKRSFGSGNGRVDANGDRSERSWRKSDAVDVLPQSFESADEKTENGHAEEAENVDSEN